MNEDTGSIEASMIDNNHRQFTGKELSQILLGNSNFPTSPVTPPLHHRDKLDNEGKGNDNADAKMTNKTLAGRGL